MKEFGYVKLYRKSLDSSVWKNPNVFMVWAWCLLKSNHETHNFPFNGSDMEIKAGQFITGRSKALKELPITTQTYKTCLSYLKSTNRITIKTTNKFSIITIVNWEKYQIKNEKLTSKLNNQQPASNQPVTTYKNDKNDKNIKEVLNFFIFSFEELYNTKPATGEKDIEIIESALQNHSLDEIKEIISYYKNSEKCLKYKFKLPVALSKDTINDYILWAKAT